MNETIRLLQDVVRNARTGLDAVETLLKKSGDADMRDELAKEREQYLAAARDGERALADAGGQPEPTGLMARAGMRLGLEGETLLDRSGAHIAEIMIQGATMGVIEMTKSLNTYGGADPRARGLASRFVVQQNEVIDRQKTFLEN